MRDSELYVTKTRREFAGSCSFCTEGHYRYVWEVTGEQRRTAVRFCPACATEFGVQFKQSLRG